VNFYYFHLLSYLASSKITIASIPQREEVDKKGKAITQLILASTKGDSMPEEHMAFLVHLKLSPWHFKPY